MKYVDAFFKLAAGLIAIAIAALMIAAVFRSFQESAAATTARLKGACGEYCTQNWSDVPVYCLDKQWVCK